VKYFLSVNYCSNPAWGKILAGWSIRLFYKIFLGNSRGKNKIIQYLMYQGSFYGMGVCPAF